MTTTDELALLAAVCEHPADDTPRLAYADWLEDHAGGVACMRCAGTGKLYEWTCKVCGATPDEAGCVEHDRGCYQIDPDGGGTEWVEPEGCDKCRGTGTVPDGRRERAEFIRAQVEAARGVDIGSMVLWNLLHHADGWFPAVCEPLRLRWHDWGVMHDGTVHFESKHHTNEFFVRRGFVEEVRCTAEDWLTHADRIAWSPWKPVACHHCAEKAPDWETGVIECRRCDGSGLLHERNDEPPPPTAQPITKVTLTTLPTAEVGAFNRLRNWVRPTERGLDFRDSFEAEWDWITFTFQGAEDRR